MAASLSERLARQRARRRQGHPTVSAWACSWPFTPNSAQDVLGGPVLVSTAGTLLDAGRDWLVKWLSGKHQSIVSDRLNRHLAEALGVSEKRAQTLLTETGIQDRGMLVGQATARMPSARLERLLQWWILHPQRAGYDGVAALDQALSEIDPRADLRALVSMAELCPPEDRPWVACVPPEDLQGSPLAWLDAAAQRMEAFATALPDWPAVVAAPEVIWQAAKAAKAAVPEAVGRLQANLLEPVDTGKAEPADVVPFYDLDTSFRSLLRGQGTEADDDDDLLASPTIDLDAPIEGPPTDEHPVADASEESPWGPPTVEEPRTRDRGEPPETNVEGLLARLEADPTSAGHFVADARLEGGPGGRKVEVPLYAAEIQLAIEIDEDFACRNLDAYRRDRAKDLWLQRRGLMVVRVLAEDLETRLEHVATTLRDVVRERRIRGKRRP